MCKAWSEIISIPTYEVGAPEKNPIFLEKRVYQGSSGVVYPYPVIESISNEKVDKQYHAVYLENEYIKVMILPELGGRVQMAYDKIKQRHFVYYNSVIKPALVGLAGPWISGGIEFNWPQHHRPSTYLPVDYRIQENKDGSVTVWINEMERMFHQKGLAGFTLRPGCAYLEIEARLSNRTDIPQTFLWWANPAVKVNDDYQSVFPQDVNAVFDHGKRAVSTFPIATGTYYKMDYSSGVDISNYKNIKVPTSYMAVNSKYDFEGGYENDTKGGMLHVANHHVSPGKKQWTWGNGDFGRAWDRNLTDEDGPYIELMAGVFTENQPDFTWLQPYEQKTFTQYFMPYRELGLVKNASKDLIMNILQPEAGKARLLLQATSRQKVAVVVKGDDGQFYYDAQLDLSPENIFDETIEVAAATIDDLNVLIYRQDNNRLMLQWHAESKELKKVPDAAEAALSPEDTKTVEQLYLTGLHLEQYRHATWSALDYYEEGLRRDPLDLRCNNALGLWYIRRGRFDRAESYLRTAVKVITKRNPNPYDSEPLYNLGLCLKYQGRLDEAYDCFYKASWSSAQQDQAFFACAQISVAQGRYEDALEELDKSIARNSFNHKARALKVAVLNILGRKTEARRLASESLVLDPFNYGCLFETRQLSLLKTLMHDSPYNYQELCLDYAQAGLWTSALEVIKLSEQRKAVGPMNYYYKSWFLWELDDVEGSHKAWNKAESTDSYCCFPNRLEDVRALDLWTGARASYYLGCLYYDKRQYDEAVRLWMESSALDPLFPTVWRNLALAMYNKLGDPQTALDYMLRAFDLDSSDSRVLMELDQLYKAMEMPAEFRYDFLQKHSTLVEQRDDLVLEVITLLNDLGRYEEAMTMLDAHIFHPWEGGEGKVPAQYQRARVALAQQAISDGNPQKAITLLEQCLVYPHHLGEGKLHNAQDNDFYYYMGCAYEQMGQMDAARSCWNKATEGPTEPAAAMYYNDANPNKIYFAGLAYHKLGQDDKAKGFFHRLISYGEKHIFDEVKMDYFAVSLPDLLIWDGDLQEKNTIHCKKMMALGHDGLKQLR